MFNLPQHCDSYVGAGGQTDTKGIINIGDADRYEAVHHGEVEGNVVRVLLVDDQSNIRFLQRLLLERDGRAIVVAEAADGREAIAAASREQPDAIVLDLDMPEVTGLEALPLLLEVSPDSVVIVLSSLPEADYGSQAVALGASTFIAKNAVMRDESLLLDALHDSAPS